MRTLQPPGWARPRGYANGIAADAGGTLVFVAGQIGWDAGTGEFPDRDLTGQVRRTLENVLAVLAETGGRAEHVVRLTWYVTNRADYLKKARELQDHVKARIAPYKYPRAVEFVEALPRTPTGKVQRNVLRER